MYTAQVTLMYNCRESLGTNITKVVQLPLGYMKGMLDHYQTNSNNGFITSDIIALQNKHILSSQRSLNWSFIGTTSGRKERAHAISVFSTWNNHTIDAGLTAPQMHEIYKQSKFVIIGRGQANLDCFRIYESLIAGAIPVRFFHNLTHIHAPLICFYFFR